MINHRLRCIFVHIQRTGGTSIELALNGHDTWQSAPETKHISASQAKILYKPFWDEYFKFSFVREPLSRHISMLRYAPDHFYQNDPLIINGSIQLTPQMIDNYIDLYGSPVTIEHDQRYNSKRELIKPWHGPGMVYSNIIDENLDFIGKFESLQSDFDHICSCLNISPCQLPHSTSSLSGRFSSYSISKTPYSVRKMVSKLYKYDFGIFKYNRPS